jgi:transposase
MYIETVKNRKSPPCILLRESYRNSGKVCKRTLANLTALPKDALTALKKALNGNNTAFEEEKNFEIIRSLPHGHVVAVLETLRKIDLDNCISSKPSHERDLILSMIVARLLNPGSKLATARGLSAETAFCSLGEELNLLNINEDNFYEAMDWLVERQDKIQNKLAKKHLSNGCTLLYDTSSSYFEGRKCPLAKRGHSRDKKTGKLQINYGLICDVEGRPIAIEVFEGNTSDPATLSSQIQKIKNKFKISKVIFVADRGVITQARIDEELKFEIGLDWISALTSKSVNKLIKTKALIPSDYDEKDFAQISAPDYPGERLIVCLNKSLREERRRVRECLLKATENELDMIVKATNRLRSPLKEVKEIGLRVGKVRNKYKVGKHFLLEISEGRFSYRRNEKKIAEEAVLDGFYVIRTSVDEATIDAEETIAAYKNLSKVERAFRCCKTVDLQIRPIYHRLPDRVEAHVFICMLAYYVEWHMRKALAPVLFDDHNKAEAIKQRHSIVAPAQRSSEANLKASSKKTKEGFAVHSFQTLLSDLQTIVKNRIQLKGTINAIFDKITTPTPSQKRIFELLDIKI